jgi:hypothetical protein
MPKGKPGEVKPKQRRNTERRLYEEGERELLAEMLPKINRAKDSLPPTKKEIESVRVYGSDTIRLPNHVDRWHFRRGHSHVGD